MDWPGVSVVVPVFQSDVSLQKLVPRIHAELVDCGEFEIIPVDDGSREATWKSITELSQEWPVVSGIRLGRNFGQHNALVAGIRAASMPVIVTIDDDLQNPPEEISILVSELLSNHLDVVYGVPTNVRQPFPRRLAGKITRLALRTGLGMESAPDVSSFRAFRAGLREAFDRDLGPNVSLDALLTWGGSKFGSVSVGHDTRAVGTSNYTFGRLLKFAVDTTTGYSTLPLQIASVVGLATASFGLCILIFVIMRPLIVGESVPGFPFLASIIVIFSGVHLLTLGVIGEYLARIHFRVMHKPTYVVSERSNETSEGL